MQAATRIEIHRIFFCEVYLYLISKCFKKSSLMTFLLKQSYSSQNSTIRYHRSFYEEVLKHLHRKVWKNWKLSRKTYLV